MKNIALVYNPCGGSTTKSKIAALVDAFSAHGVGVEMLATSNSPLSAKSLALSAHEAGVDAVVACGGDGTVGQVAEGLSGMSTPMVVYPGGTGNLFSRSFHLDSRPAAVVKRVLDGIPQGVDLIETSYEDLSGRRHVKSLINAFSMGSLSNPIVNASRFWKRWLGVGAYALGILGSALSPVPARLNVACVDKDGKHHRSETFSSVLLVVANTLPPLYSNLSRGCNPFDGLMDVFSIDARTPFDFIPTVAGSLLLKPERSRHFRRFRTGRMRVEFSTPLLPNVDGEAGSLCRAIDFEVKPGAVQAILV